MPEILNNVTVSDEAFTPAATATFQRTSRKVTFIVANAGVFMQMLRVTGGLRTTGGTWYPPEGEFLVPGVYSRAPSDFAPGGIRFRAATAVQPAQVTARAA